MNLASQRFFILFQLISIGILFTSCEKNPEGINSSAYPLADANGIDSQQLIQTFNTLRTIPQMKAFLVARNGVIVAEENFNQYHPKSLHDVRSVTKSITSILIGIAIEEGFIQNIDQSIADYLEPLMEVFPEEKRAITIRHLLTMSGGFAWAEFTDWSEYSNWNSAPNQLEYILNKPLVHPPGTVFNYNDGACHLLSIIIAQASGMDTHEFAKQYLFIPLGITGTVWLNDNQGYPKGCVGLQLSPHDMFKLGQLYLQGGEYQGERIISSEWVNESTRPQISTQGAVIYGENYGYLWWNQTIRGHQTFMAMGYGGQFIFCVPQLNLVVVSQCLWNVGDQQAAENWMTIIDLIVDQILPTVREQATQNRKR
jgi:CubicO group peptidase (beta-lactamase class C family)